MSAHRYWALTNITVRSNADSVYLREVSKLGFVTKSGTLSNNPANIFASSILNPSSTETYYPSNALDDDIKTVFSSSPNDVTNNGLNLRIWYVFDKAEEVTHIQIQHRSLTLNREWQTAEVEYSDDGVTWIKFGRIEPKIAYQDTGLKTVQIVKIAKAEDLASLVLKKPLIVNTITRTEIDNINETFFNSLKSQNSLFLTFDSQIKVPLFNTIVIRDTLSDGRVVQSAYIAGRVYEKINGKLIPVVRTVYCYNQATGALIGCVYSNEKGEYLFKNLNLGNTYMIVSFDPNKVYGLEGVAFKKAREVVTNGLQVSYPIID